MGITTIATRTHPVTHSIATRGRKMESSMTSPQATQILPARRWVLFQFSSLLIVQEILIPRVLFWLTFGR